MAYRTRVPALSGNLRGLGEMHSTQHRRLTRREASDYLKAQGYQIEPTTLAKYACVGGGPPYESFGRKPLYTEVALLEWVASRTTGPRRTTSEQAA